VTEAHGYRPKWGWFAAFAVGVLVYPWDDSLRIALPIGFAVTLLLVFVPRWPSRRTLAPLVVWLAVAFAAVIAIALVASPPDPDQAGSAIFVVVVAAMLLTGSLLWWRSVRRPPIRGKGPEREVRAVLDADTSQWERGQEPDSLLRVVVGSGGYLTLLDCPAEQARELRRTQRLRLTEPDRRGRVRVRIGDVLTPGLFTTEPTGLPGRPWSFRRARWLAALAVPTAVLVIAGVLAGVVAAVWFLGGYGWLFLLPALFWGGLAAMWAGQVRESWQTLQGPLTPRRAGLAHRHVWPGAPLRGWMVMEPGWPVQFEVAHCPPEFAAELLNHRRVWLYETPTTGEAAFGLPGQDGYLKVLLSDLGRRILPEEEPVLVEAG